MRASLWKTSTSEWRLPARSLLLGLAVAIANPISAAWSDTAATLGVTGCSRLDYAPGVFSVAEPTVDVPAAPSFRNYTLCGAVFSSEHRIELKRRLRAGYLLPLEALVILIALTAGNFARGPQPGDFARLD
jgi:hypothetical protein